MSQKVNKNLLFHLRKVIHGKKNYPIGALAFFGPDDATVTKIVAFVINKLDADPLIRTWNKPEVVSDPSVAEEIGKLFTDHCVVDVVMTDGIVGCPHDEGVDFPLNDDCPYCQYWSLNS